MIETDDIEQSLTGFIVAGIGLLILGVGALFKRWRRD